MSSGPSLLSLGPEPVCLPPSVLATCWTRSPSMLRRVTYVNTPIALRRSLLSSRSLSPLLLRCDSFPLFRFNENRLADAGIVTSVLE